ncbi:MAG: urate hydroxylase PuuD, partial [Rhodobacteraceae bacterium]|nr:urate hydroxylase PuuD [Paracoccaceae bacterium]
LIIIPNQKTVVADLKAGRSPSPEFGRIGKLRSTHNNYLTLPVIFLMLSNHYPLAFATEYNWLICALVFLMGVTIRHYFNTVHARKGHPHWTWALTALIFILIMWLSALAPPGSSDESLAEAAGRQPTTDLAALHSIVETRCTVCHSRTPSWGTMQWPPKNIILETDDQVLQLAREIYLQSGMSDAMPPANLTNMLPSERAFVRTWHQNLRNDE